MRRGLHISIGLMLAVLLLAPFDCFAAGTPDRQAADCCLKGKCVPTANSDECCKNPLPDNDQIAPSKVTGRSSPLIALTAHMPTLASPTFLAVGGPVSHPPPDIPLTSSSLPLLV